MNKELLKQLSNLLDSSYQEEILLPYNNKIISYSKIAVLPNDSYIYFILKPNEPIIKLEMDEAVVYRINKNDLSLNIIDDKEELEMVFQMYLKAVKPS